MSNSTQSSTTEAKDKFCYVQNEKDKKVNSETAPGDGHKRLLQPKFRTSAA